MTSLDAAQAKQTDWWPRLLFEQKQQMRLLIASALVLIPCFWHRHIEAGDLSSHIYNAWLAHLIEAGKTPGLWVAKRWNNVLFDFALSGIGRLFGWNVAEKAATSAAVEIFVWGTFAFACAVNRRVCWFLLPFLAMVAYGWIFEMGFMNCYLSIGLAFLGLAILVGGRGRQRWLVAAIVPLIWLAHPLGIVFLVSIGLYILIAERVSLRGQLCLLVGAALFIAGVHAFIRAHADSIYAVWNYEPGHPLDGFDQFLLYQPHTLIPARLFRIFVASCLAVGIIRARYLPGSWRPLLVPSQIWLLTFFAAQMLPTDINAPLLNRMGLLSIGFVTERLTIVCAIMACCLLGGAHWERWHFVGFGIPALYFFFLYQDTGVVNRMEAREEALVRGIQPGLRVIATIFPFPPRSNVSMAHTIDRVCVDRCFNYANYEASTREFRVRARPGNPYVMADAESAWSVVSGKYVVQEHDLPLLEIYQSATDINALKIRELAVGDRTNSLLGTGGPSFTQAYSWGALLFDFLVAPIPVVVLGGIWRRREKAAT